MEPGRFAGNPLYYVLLEVSPDADAATLQAAFRRQVRRFHPDVNPDPEAAARMRDINAAYAILSDPVRRGAYDAAHETDRGGAVYAHARPATGIPVRGVGVRSSAGSYAPRWGGAVGGTRPATVGVATATTHGTSFLDPDQAPVSPARPVPEAPVDLGWAARVARVVEAFGPGTVREVSPASAHRATVTPTPGTLRARALGGILAALVLAIAGAAAGSAFWGGPGILSTASVATGAPGAGAPMTGPAVRPAVAPVRPVTVAVVAPSDPLAPLVPVVPAAPGLTNPGASGVAIPAPLAPLAPSSAPAMATGSGSGARAAGALLAGVAAVPENGASVPTAGGSGASRAVTSATTASAPGVQVPAGATATPGLRALNAYDQAWTAYATTLRRGAAGDATASSVALSLARVRFLEARTAWVRQAVATPDAGAARRASEVIALTSEADQLARDAATLVSQANGAPVPAARALLDEAARRHARALATWSAAHAPA